MPTTTEDYIDDIKRLATELHRLNRDYEVRGIKVEVQKAHASLYTLIEHIKATGVASGPAPKLDGCEVVITKNGGMNGRRGIIEFFDTTVNKYTVVFKSISGDWRLWYDRNEFILNP